MFGNVDFTIILSVGERIVTISSDIFVKILCVGFTMNYIRKIESLDIQGSLFLRRYAWEVVPYGLRALDVIVGVDVLGDPCDVLGDPFFSVRPGGRTLQQYTAS